jgi:hypothetical protein
MNETEARDVLQDVITRYQRNSYDALREAAHRGERIAGKVAGPSTGALYPIIIATEWDESETGDIRVTIVVHDEGANHFGHIAANFVKSPDTALQ